MKGSRMAHPFLFRVALALAAAATLDGAAISQAADENAVRRGRFEALDAEFERRTAAFDQAEENARTENQKLKARQLKPSLQEYSKKALALAREKPGDDVALDALIWVVDHYDADETPAELAASLELIEKHQLASAGIREGILSLAFCDSAKAGRLLELLIEKGNNRNIRGLACFCLANGRHDRYDGRNPADLAAIARLFEKVRSDFADVIDDAERPLGKLAESHLYEINHLEPGHVAPEIEGTDPSGRRLKLTDFRGKVVLLVFWGSWCGPCMAEVPHLRERMQAYAGRPFTVVGINSGDTQEQATKVIKEKNMTWPIFHDGRTGPIVDRWNVSAFPTMYLLDAQGKIRVKYIPDEAEFEKLIGESVREAEKNNCSA
jgi:peroxiredoxin